MIIAEFDPSRTFWLYGRHNLPAAKIKHQRRGKREDYEPELALSAHRPKRRPAN